MKKLAYLAAVAVLVGLPSLALADTVTYGAVEGGIGSTLTDWGQDPVHHPDNPIVYLSFPQFNPTLGTLTQVAITLNSDMSTIIAANNTSSTSGSSGDIQTHLRIYVGSTKWFDVFFPEGYWHFDINAGGSASSDQYSFAAGPSSTTYTSGLESYIGTGSIGLSSYTYTSTSGEWSGGNTIISQITFANLQGEITYTYSPVPIPASALLLGSGLLGLLALRGWRKKPSA